MERYNHYHEYLIYAFILTILSLLGSVLSLLNLIPLLISYQLIQKAQPLHDTPLYHITDGLHQSACLLTIALSVLYITLQF